MKTDSPKGAIASSEVTVAGQKGQMMPDNSAGQPSNLESEDFEQLEINDQNGEDQEHQILRKRTMREARVFSSLTESFEEALEADLEDEEESEQEESSSEGFEFPCAVEGCDKVFSSTKSLSSHMNRHNGS